MCNHIIKIGLVAAPGVTETIANHLQQELPSLLSSTINSKVKWQIDTMIDPLTGSALKFLIIKMIMNGNIRLV